MAVSLQEIDKTLADDMSRFYDDPVGFVMYAFPWGEGELEGYDRPDTWQEEFLAQIGAEVRRRAFNGVDAVLPLRMSTASGRGIGKSALTAILILWIMSTRPKAKGTVTANTGDQLHTKTWAELRKWKDLCITGHWFEYNNSKGNMVLYHKAFQDTWRVDALTCREENAGAFAGQHNANSTSFFIFDEAAEVPDALWEIALTGQTDGEPMFFAFGNPTRNTGYFRNTLESSRWIVRHIDSRNVRMTNKELIAEEIADYGEDSDRVRVHVRGLPPRASDNQFFPSDIVADAMKRPLPRNLGDEPLVCGIDYSRGGSDKSVIQFRRGRDARSELRYEIPGEKTRDSMKVAAIIAEVLNRHQPDITFGDVGSMGGPINDRLRQLGHNVVDVGFGEKAREDKKYANRTAEMSRLLLVWLQNGGCLPFVPELESDLISRGFAHDSHDRLVMESKRDMKKRLGRSPDDMDALLLTFAAPAPVHLDYTRDDRPLGLRDTPMPPSTGTPYRAIDEWQHRR